MAKGQDAKKSTKKQGKTLKEKRKQKKEKAGQKPDVLIAPVAQE